MAQPKTLRGLAGFIIRGLLEQAQLNGVISATEARNKEIKYQIMRSAIDSGEIYERYTAMSENELDELIRLIEDRIK